MSELLATIGPEDAERLRKILEYQDENQKPNHNYIEDTDYDSFFTYKDVGINPQALYQLETKGYIERVFDTNSTTAYTLSNPSEMGEKLDGYKEDQNADGIPVKTHEFPDEEDLPDDLFDDVIGYDDVKWLIKRALTTDDIINILLVGPPGSAKTVFLLAINELKDSTFMSGSPTSGPGVLDTMFRETPKYMLIDEFDDMDNDVQQVLSQHMDTGILDETKHGKDRSMRINTNTFGSANDLDGVIEQVESRFLDLHFDPYTEDEFREICAHLLPKREGCGKEEANKIADEVWRIEGFGDVRKAIAVARLSRGDPEKVVSVLDNYPSTGTTYSL